MLQFTRLATCNFSESELIAKFARIFVAKITRFYSISISYVLVLVSSAGCSMGEMWDVEDPKNYNRQLFCMTVNGGNIPKPFTQVFSNQVYQVLKVS